MVNISDIPAWLLFSLRFMPCTCVTPALWRRPLTWLNAWYQNTLRRPSSSAPCTPSPSSPYFCASLRYLRSSAGGSVISTTSDTNGERKGSTRSLLEFTGLCVSRTLQNKSTQEPSLTCGTVMTRGTNSKSTTWRHSPGACCLSASTEHPWLCFRSQQVRPGWVQSCCLDRWDG